MRFLIYENYEDPWKIGLFFWWRHNRSRWRHNILKFAGVLDFGLIFSKKQSSLKFDIPAACWIKVQAPYFLNSIIEKSTNSKENPQTRPFFPLSQPCWIRWCSQIWWLIGVERYWFYFCKLPLVTESGILSDSVASSRL